MNRETKIIARLDMALKSYQEMVEQCAVALTTFDAYNDTDSYDQMVVWIGDFLNQIGYLLVFRNDIQNTGRVTPEAEKMVQWSCEKILASRERNVRLLEHADKLRRLEVHE